MERLNRCGGKQRQEKRVTRENCGVERYKEWTIQICMNRDGQLPKSSEKVQTNQQKGSDWLLPAAVSVGWRLGWEEGEEKVERATKRICSAQYELF